MKNIVQKLFWISLVICIAVGPALAKKKITLPTERAVFHNNQGIVAMNAKDLDRASFEFKTAIELSPQYVEAYNNLGIVYKLRGEYDLAAAQFKRAIELDKKYAAAYSHLGAVELAEGNIDAAILTIKKGLKHDGTLADGHYNLGLAYIEKTKQSKDKNYVPLAEASFKKATELDANLRYVHEELGDVYRSVGNYELAIIRYRLALGNDPKSVKLWLKLGNLYLEKHEPYQAQNCFEKALEIDPQAMGAHMQLGLFYLNEKRYTDAANEFKSVTTLNPVDELAWFRLGSVELAAGDDAHAERKEDDAQKHYQSAEGAFAKAKEVNPAFADAMFNLGLTFLKQGRRDLAEKEWERALVVDPQHARTLYNLGTAYQLDGRKSDATKMLCRFIGAAGQTYPAEAEAARKIIAAGDQKCQH